MRVLLPQINLLQGVFFTIPELLKGAQVRPSSPLAATVSAKPIPLSPASSSIPNRLAVSTEYREIHVYQQGGLGVVCKAIDRRLNREVAVKIIRDSHRNDPDAIQRFQAEAEITGRLDHPGIAPIYGHGWTSDGVPFYAMKFVEGRDLGEAIEAFFSQVTPSFDDLEFVRLLTSFMSVCRTIGFAHGRGIIHRDIKPQNIRIGQFHETIVLDWGLAVSMDRKHAIRDGEPSILVLANGANPAPPRGGTPGYMSPEQLSGSIVTPASDIYSLGAVLYRILTGQATLSTRTPETTLEALTAGGFPTPRELQPGLPRPLEAICLKALSLQPSERYESAQEMASDVERFLSGQSVSCYHETPYERCGRWIRHHQAWARHIALGLVTIAIASVLLMLATWRLAANREQQLLQAETQRNEATAAREDALLEKRRSLVLASRLAARSIAAEIELRGAMLREEARSSNLRKWVAAWNSDPGNSEPMSQIKEWLKDRFLARAADNLPTSTWNIQGVDGTQLGRVATRDADGGSASLGKSFRYRDYFHALGQDLDPASAEAALAQPHRYDVHVSSVFVSTNTAIPSVSFSTPIHEEADHSPESQVIGIFASTVHLNRMDLLPGATLVDLRPNVINGQRLEGVVLRHGKLDANRSKQQSWYTLSAEDLARIRTFLAERPRRFESLANFVDDPLVEIVDPITETKVHVAVAPVILANQPDHNQVGWVVLMQP